MIIAVDFDGTLTEKDIYPDIAQPRTDLINWLKQKKNNGHKLILWTCRIGIRLNEAVAWCREQGLEFDAVNENLGSYPSRKIVADVYIDDRAVPVGDAYDSLRF